MRAPDAFAFRKILPKRRAPAAGAAAALSHAQLAEVIEQVDVFVQLLLQNCLFMPQIELLNLAHRLILEKKHLLFLNGLRSYEVYLVDLKFGNSSLKTLRHFLCAQFDADGWRQDDLARPPALEQFLTFEFAPQISVLQCPALEAQGLLEEAARKNLPKDRRVALLAELVPLLRKNYIPVLGEAPRSGTNKFAAAEDALLLNGLLRHSCKNLPAVQAQFLPHKSLEEVRNRYKNLTRQKAPLNAIKSWKLREAEPLSAAERQNLEKGQLWFGRRNFRLIARYFLCTRSERFLARQAELLEKRGEPPAEAAEVAGLDRASDFCAEPPEVARENREFIDFLKSFLSNNRSIAEIVARPSQSCHSLSLNLSAAKLSLRSYSKRSKRLLELKRDSFAATHIRLVDDELHLSTRQVTASDIKHAFLDEQAFEAKHPKAAVCGSPGTVRLAPTFRELQIAAAAVVERKNFTVRNNSLYDKIII